MRNHAKLEAIIAEMEGWRLRVRIERKQLLGVCDAA
jgi:hypothetical protein